MTSCSRALHLGTRSVPYFRDFLCFFVLLFFLTILRFVNWFFLRFFVSNVSHNVSEESRQSSTCLRVFLLYLAFNTRCWPRRKPRKIKKFHSCMLVLLSQTCSESQQLSDSSAIFLRDPVTGQSRTILASGNQYEETNCACLLRALPIPLYNGIPRVQKMNSKLVTFSCSGASLTRETKILHQEGIKFKREGFFWTKGFKRKTKQKNTRCQGDQK